MQTRKRAKSVTFGKKTKESEEKEHVKKTVENEELSLAAKKVSENTEHTESNEEIQSGLSATPPKTDDTATTSTVETPASEFVSDNPLSSSPELPKEEKEPESAIDAPQTAELSQPIETPAQPSPTSEPQTESASHELSATPPPSAFTIQTNEQTTQSTAAETEVQPVKKHFGLYFIVVALLSFILGLGAMAGASYLGWVNVNLTKLPAGVQIPGLVGQKPTPTSLPPTVAPTEKPVDLTAFTITVLNGSGISGKAADAKKTLTSAGFTVSSTGNADKSTYTQTEISAKKTVNHDYLTKLETELNKSYSVDTTIATSPDSDSSDVTVTLGSQTAQ